MAIDDISEWPCGCAIPVWCVYERTESIWEILCNVTVTPPHTMPLGIPNHDPIWEILDRMQIFLTEPEHGGV